MLNSLYEKQHTGLIQHITNKLLDTGTVLFHRPIWKKKQKNTLVLLWNVWPRNTIRLGFFAMLLAHFVSLFPDLFFWGPTNTTQMCKCFFNGKCGENVSRGVKKREKENKREEQKAKCHNDVSVLYIQKNIQFDTL